MGSTSILLWLGYVWIAHFHIAMAADPTWSFAEGHHWKPTDNISIPTQDCADGQTLLVDTSWTSVTCSSEDAQAISQMAGHRFAVNGIEPHALKNVTHLPIYNAYSPYLNHGWKSNILTDFMGVKWPTDMYCNKAYLTQPRAHALRYSQCEIQWALQHSEICKRNCDVQTSWPLASEEYFEYADILESVLEYANTTQAQPPVSRRPFTFVELAAGCKCEIQATLRCQYFFGVDLQQL